VHNLPWSCTWQQLKDTFREWKVERADIVLDAWGKSRCVFWVGAGRSRPWRAGRGVGRRRKDLAGWARGVGVCLAAAATRQWVGVPFAIILRWRCRRAACGASFEGASIRQREQQQHAAAADARLPSPRPPSPPPRGFGTVRFTSREDAEAAIEKLNNSDFEGRTVTVRLDRYA
jgi:RNA recognition motif-containing protein